MQMLQLRIVSHSHRSPNYQSPCMGTRRLRWWEEAGFPVSSLEVITAKRQSLMFEGWKLCDNFTVQNYSHACGAFLCRANTKYHRTFDYNTMYLSLLYCHRQAVWKSYKLKKSSSNIIRGERGWGVMQRKAKRNQQNFHGFKTHFRII